MHPALVLMDCSCRSWTAWRRRGASASGSGNSHRPRLPIVALTAAAFDEDRDQSLAAGMDEFLTKPIDVHDLALTINKWVAERKRRVV